jgi:hypothetical protein
VAWAGFISGHEHGSGGGVGWEGLGVGESWSGGERSPLV